MRVLLLLVLFTFLSSAFVAQESYDNRAVRGRRELAIGVGVSSASFALAMRLASNSQHVPEIYRERLVTMHQTPVLTVDYQDPVDRLFSIGFAASAQQFRADYEFFDPEAGVRRIVCGDLYTRVNVGLRLIVNLANNPVFSSYFGFRAGCTAWTLNSALGNHHEKKIPGPLPSFQVFYGARYFFTRRFGAGFEIGLGTAPYLAQGNLAYRL